MTSQALPVPLRSADDVTPEVLTSLLRHHDPGATVTGVTVRRTWQGTTSHLHLDVDYADPDTPLPRRLFVKTQLSTVHDLPAEFDVSLSEGGGGTVLYDDETRFYRDLRADLDVETMTTYFADHLDGPAQFLILGEALEGLRKPEGRHGVRALSGGLIGVFDGN